nr:hypothetical protein [Prevotella sp.]
MVLAFDINNVDDSTTYYTKLAERNMKGCTCGDSVNVYNNLAYHYLYKRSDFKRAEHYLNLSLQCDSFAGTLTFLADLSIKKGDIKKGLYLYRILLSSKDDDYRVIALKKLCKYYKSIGDYKQAYNYNIIVDSLMDSLYDVEQSKTLNDLQMKYDTGFIKAESHRKIATLAIIILLVIVIFLLFTSALFCKLRNKRKEVELIKCQLFNTRREINAIEDDRNKSVEEKSHELKSVINDKKHCIRVLRTAIDEDEE